MKAKCFAALLFSALAWADEAAERAAIGHVISVFNHTARRSTVLAPGADLSDLNRFQGRDVSQVYFEVREVKFLGPEAAIVDASGSQFGSQILKRAIPALFVMTKENGAWRIALLRTLGPCVM
ncbi:MAG TPA: hypothetical protein VGF59_27910 [Bryobacteraceae bacterium]